MLIIDGLLSDRKEVVNESHRRRLWEHDCSMPSLPFEVVRAVLARTVGLFINIALLATMTVLLSGGYLLFRQL
jgi:hypothetical protein